MVCAVVEEGWKTGIKRNPYKLWNYMYRRGMGDMYIYAIYACVCVIGGVFYGDFCRKIASKWKRKLCSQ